LVNIASAPPRSSTPTGCDLAHKYPAFRAYADLPAEVSAAAEKLTAFQKRSRLEENPLRREPVLSRFPLKQMHTELPIDSVRITREYRALGVWDGEAIVRVEAITLLFAPYRRRRAVASLNRGRTSPVKRNR